MESEQELDIVHLRSIYVLIHPSSDTFDRSVITIRCQIDTNTMQSNQDSSSRMTITPSSSFIKHTLTSSIPQSLPYTSCRCTFLFSRLLSNLFGTRFTLESECNHREQTIRIFQIDRDPPATHPFQHISDSLHSFHRQKPLISSLIPLLPLRWNLLPLPILRIRLHTPATFAASHSSSKTDIISYAPSDAPHTHLSRIRRHQRLPSSLLHILLSHSPLSAFSLVCSLFSPHLQLFAPFSHPSDVPGCIRLSHQGLLCRVSTPIPRCRPHPCLSASSSSDGGALHLFGCWSSSTTSLPITRCSSSDCPSRNGGGAGSQSGGERHCFSPDFAHSVSGSLFRKCSATQYGGRLYSSRMVENSKICGCLYKDNTAYNNRHDVY